MLNLANFIGVLVYVLRYVVVVTTTTCRQLGNDTTYNTEKKNPTSHDVANTSAVWGRHDGKTRRHVVKTNCGRHLKRRHFQLSARPETFPKGPRLRRRRANMARHPVLDVPGQCFKIRDGHVARGILCEVEVVVVGGLAGGHSFGGGGGGRAGGGSRGAGEMELCDVLCV
jgi:hypothetical protein